MNDAELLKTHTIKWLIKGHLGFNKARDAIATEVLFSKNRRKADLLILSNISYTLEIKSDADDLRKLKLQLRDYCNTFDKVSIITTSKYVDSINRMINRNTGLILFNNNNFKIIKHAKLNKRLNKHSLLMFLPKTELIRLGKFVGVRRLSTDEIRNILSHRMSTCITRKLVLSFLKKRYLTLFRLLLKDTEGKIVWDDLRGLCGNFDKLYA
jgi:hypothetical protein